MSSIQYDSNPVNRDDDGRSDTNMFDLHSSPRSSEYWDARSSPHYSDYKGPMHGGSQTTEHPLVARRQRAHSESSPLRQGNLPFASLDSAMTNSPRVFLNESNDDYDPSSQRSPARDNYRPGLDEPSYSIEETTLAGIYREVFPSICENGRIVIYSDASRSHGQAALGVAYCVDGVWHHHAMSVPDPDLGSRDGREETERVELKAVELALMIGSQMARQQKLRAEIAAADPNAANVEVPHRVFVYTDCERAINRLIQWHGTLEQRTRSGPLRVFDLDRGIPVPRQEWAYSEKPQDFALDGTWAANSNEAICLRIMSMGTSLWQDFDVRTRLAHVYAHSGVEGNERADRTARFGKLARTPRHAFDYGPWTFWTSHDPVRVIPEYRARWWIDACGKIHAPPLLWQLTWHRLEGREQMPVAVAPNWSSVDEVRSGHTLKTPTSWPFNEVERTHRPLHRRASGLPVLPVFTNPW